jgi:carbonic anhydrase
VARLGADAILNSTHGGFMTHRHHAALSRRDWVKGAALGAGAVAFGAAGPGRLVAEVPRRAAATPEQALAQLYEGNRRFVAGDLTSPTRNMARLKEVAPKQAPFAAFLGCADSRVPIEIVFDQGFGDLFVTRVAGNVATPEVIGSLEFGTAVLGAKVLYVLGHSACGAVTATAKGDAVPGQISSLYYHIRPAVKSAGGDVDRAIEQNVRHQAELLAEASPVIAGLVKAGLLRVAGGVYDLSSGRVAPVAL